MSLEVEGEQLHPLHQDEEQQHPEELWEHAPLSQHPH